MSISCKSFILVFNLIFFVVNVQAQNKEIDSLKHELSIHKAKDTIRVGLIYNLAFASLQTDLETTKLYLKQTEDLSHTLNYTKGKANALYLRGILENIKGDYATSLAFFKRSLEHYESIQDQGGIADINVAFGRTYFSQAKYKEALTAYKKASGILEELGDKRNFILNLVNIANIYVEQGKYNDALQEYKRILKQYEDKEVDDKNGMSSVYSNLGVVYQIQGNYLLAIDHYNKSLAINEKNGNISSMMLNLNNLGEVYIKIEKYDKAIGFHEKSLKLAIQNGNKDLIRANNGNIGNVYSHKKEYSKALEYYNKALETSQEINNVKSTAIHLVNIGNLNLLLNKPIIARENFNRVIDISEKIVFKRGLSYGLIGIAEAYLIEKQYKKALPFTQKGKAIAEELQLLEVEKKAAELLSEIFENTGEYKKALESHQRYKILNDSLFNKENIEKITQLEYEYKYKNELESAEKRELNLTKTVIATSEKLEKSQLNLLLGIITFLSITIILGIVIFSLRVRNVKSKEENIIVEQKLLRSQMTPHFIFNALSVLQGIILNNENKKAAYYLTKFSRLLRITLENSRDKMVPLSQELTAIESYIELQNIEVAHPYHYTISNNSSIDTNKYKIPPMLIQPFIENAIEHGFQGIHENKEIDIVLDHSMKGLTCVIKDNGVGISPSEERIDHGKKSLSTVITSERLDILSKNYKIKGSICVENRKKYNEQGTLVTLVIPYKIEEVV